MKLLITGGMGFIGSNFIRRLHARYPTYEFLNVDALTYAGNPTNLADLKEGDRYGFIKGDIADEAFVRRVIEENRPDAIINFAAESHVDRSFVGAGAFIRTNVLGTEHLLHFARDRGIPLVHISTDEVYGDVLEGYSNEEAPMRPSNPYAASKAGADLLAQTYMRSQGAPVIIVRGSNNFGPYQYPEKLIPLAITNILEGKKIPVHGDGTHIRTWIHVNDFADGIDLALHKATPGSIYNIAGHEASNREVLGWIMDALMVVPEDMLEFVSDRPSPDLRYAPDASKIQRELGWKPAYHIKDAIGEVIAWYQEHEEWWRPLRTQKEFLEHYEKQRAAKYF